MKKSDIVEELMALHEKYELLVRLARTQPDDPWERRSEAQQTRDRFPKEAALLAGVDGQWHHGFNSGVLAATRLAVGLLGRKAEVELAFDTFPDLDT